MTDNDDWPYAYPQDAPESRDPRGDLYALRLAALFMGLLMITVFAAVWKWIF